jgi:hypothetical protein
MTILDDDPEALSRANIRLALERHKAMVRKAINEYEKAAAEPECEPMAWAPLAECLTCGTWLTHETRSCVVGTCQTCLYNRNAKAEQMRRDAAEEKNRKSAREAWRCGLFLIGCVVGLIALAVLAGWAAGAGR